MATPARAQRRRSERAKKAPKKAPAKQNGKTPEGEEQVIDLSGAQSETNGVLVHKIRQGDQMIVHPVAVGDVQDTEVITLLELAAKRARAMLGLD